MKLEKAMELLQNADLAYDRTKQQYMSALYSNTDTDTLRSIADAHASAILAYDNAMRQYRTIRDSAHV